MNLPIIAVCCVARLVCENWHKNEAVYDASLESFMATKKIERICRLSYSTLAFCMYM